MAGQPEARAGGISPSSTVNEVLRRHPGTVAVFNAFGIDSCCGGAESLADASRRDGVELEALLTALHAQIMREPA
jgi:regulator of cell morphogenesis and NO signaling